MEERTYVAIDLKSFYASVECVDRGLDPLKTNLVVADESRTEKTICLAVSPSLKAQGISGRPRLFEVVQRVRELNRERQKSAPGGVFSGSSWLAPELQGNPALKLDYIVARPQMSRYMQFSTEIYRIYLRYVSPADIHVYSVDEVFIDATSYLKIYQMSAVDFTMLLVREVLEATGITATAGIGSNLYLCKVAMDIEAKHMPADENGVRIAALNERSYREKLWDHRPLTDFWRVGRGIARKLEANRMFTMGDVARVSTYNEDLLYRLFGVNAELLIDHAWGWEPCGMAEIKAYKPESNSISSGQVLQEPYSFEKTGLVLREMTDLLALNLVEKGLVTDQLVLTLGYDSENLYREDQRRQYTGDTVRDRYGREIPKPAHGSIRLERKTSSGQKLTAAMMELFGRIADPALSVRRIEVAAARVVGEAETEDPPAFEQLDLFTDYEAEERRRAAEELALQKERDRQLAVLSIKKKFGKNAILKGMDLEEGATARLRNEQVGGHRK